MNAIKLKGQVTADRRLIVKLPSETAPGAVEVIILHEAPAKPPKRRTRRKTAHPGFGIWAKRKDITDSAEFAATLRQQVERRSNGRH
jgi:hypothetical protein